LLYSADLVAPLVSFYLIFQNKFRKIYFIFFVKGLFLGFSVLSSCEAIDLLVNIIMILLKKDAISNHEN